MDWSLVDYCDVFISGVAPIHWLQRIHWWVSDVMLISPNLFSWRNKIIYTLYGLNYSKNFFNSKNLYHFSSVSFPKQGKQGNWIIWKENWSHYAYIVHQTLILKGNRKGKSYFPWYVPLKSRPLQLSLFFVSVCISASYWTAVVSRLTCLEAFK